MLNTVMDQFLQVFYRSVK